MSPGISLEGMMLKLKLQYLTTSCEELTRWKSLWCWEGLGAGGKGDNIGWDGWIASLTWWTWVLVNSASRWWTGRPGVLEFMGSQRVRHNWATELNWTEYSIVDMYHNFLIHLSYNGHLGCFHALAIGKQCCNEEWGTCVSFNSVFLGVYAQQWDCWVIWQFYFQFFKESPHCSP